MIDPVIHPLNRLKICAALRAGGATEKGTRREMRFSRLRDITELSDATLSKQLAIAKGTPAEVLTPELLERVYGISARIINDAGVPIVCPVLRLPRHENPTNAGPMDPVAIDAETADPDVIEAISSART